VPDSEPRLAVLPSCTADPLATPFCSSTDVFGRAPVAEVVAVSRDGRCDWFVVTGGLTLAGVVLAAGAR